VVEQRIGERDRQPILQWNAWLAPRTPGTLGGVLTDERIYCQVIVDGIHVHPAMVKLMIRAKGVQRTILITDAVRAAGLQDGTYDLGGQSMTSPMAWRALRVAALPGARSPWTRRCAT